MNTFWPVMLYVFGIPIALFLSELAITIIAGGFVALFS